MSRLSTKHTDIDAVVSELSAAGVRDVEILDEYGIVADWIEGGTNELTQRLAKRFGGQWWPDPEYIAWNTCGIGGKGRKGITIVHPVALQDAQDTREVASRLMGVCPHSWNIRAIARSLLEWLGPIPDQWHRVSNIEHLLLEHYAYQKCIGGNYDYLSLWDLKSAYWQMLERLPTLYVTVTMNGGLFFPLMEEDREARWTDLKAAVRDFRALRLPMHGNMMGNGPKLLGGELPTSGRRYYTRNGPVEHKQRWGPYATAALLALRAVHELTALQAEIGVYANTDCVALPGARKPSIWEVEGLNFRLKAKGTATLLGVGVYRIGEEETKHFTHAQNMVRRGVTFREFPQSVPERLTFKEWM